jgi:hypothetical protein
MTIKQHGPKDEKLLAEIVAHFVTEAKKQGIPPPWHLQVWDDAGLVFCDVLLKEEGHEVVPSIDSTPSLPPMLHPPFRAELSDATDEDGHKLHQEGMVYEEGWRKSAPKKGNLPSKGRNRFVLGLPS